MMLSRSVTQLESKDYDQLKNTYAEVVQQVDKLVMSSKLVAYKY